MVTGGSGEGKEGDYVKHRGFLGDGTLLYDTGMVDTWYAYIKTHRTLQDMPYYV